ncbi:energy-coupling factor transporter transmembrane protein EcfT [Pararhizobium sp. BT-229]|uniref:energy-coupling factor transporter transmembrane component T family protein n=1 Tax=Pararhizobium sp. BT-229 TaxID=2986923 RepID=UPI0021F7A495|nr:energy-coupling factor transporter transmembrane protein EcfT [Pararhizobium sp. BT-229]MCV9963100.1 energy-coupling factor transporter transmembrane protein EcfT [Pararhizobium sp. BT-229]
MLNGLNVEGTTPLHRMSVRIKLALLLVCGLALYAVSSLFILIPVFVIAAIIYFTTGLAFREALSRLKPILFTILILLIATAYFTSLREAAENFFRLMAIVLFAGAVTATTATSAFIDEITRLLQPLDRLGLVRAADVGLAFGLVLRFVPDIFNHYQAIREAHRARGLKVRPLTILAPLIILTLKDADTIAMAIDARGYRRPREKQH